MQDQKRNNNLLPMSHIVLERFMDLIVELAVKYFATCNHVLYQVPNAYEILLQKGMKMKAYAWNVFGSLERYPPRFIPQSL
jgi:hypothetical protein